MENGDIKNIKAELFAYPVKHSLSPLIHNTAFAANNIFGEYGIKEVDKTNLESELRRLRHSDMLGVNLSMPNKITAMQYVDELSKEAKLAGAINTIVNNEGRLIGYNTDGIGFCDSLLMNGADIKAASFVILGAGGAAMAIISQLALLGAKGMTVIKRKNTTFDQVKDSLTKIMLETDCKIDLLDFSQTELIQEELNKSSYLINCTSVGMGQDNKELPLSSSYLLKKDLAVIDIIYYPAVTPFLAWAAQQGCQIENGLSMLVHQAAVAFNLWTGLQMPIENIMHMIKQNHEVKTIGEQ